MFFFSKLRKKPMMQLVQPLENGQSKIDKGLKHFAIYLQTKSAHIDVATKWKVLVLFVALSVGVCSYLTYKGVNASISPIAPISRPAFVIEPNSNATSPFELSSDLLKLQASLDSLKQVTDSHSRDTLFKYR